MYVLKIFLVVVAIKFSLNLIRLLETVYLFKVFKKHPANIYQYSPFITSVFNSAGTNKIVLSTIHSNGMNQASEDYISNSLGKRDSYNTIETIFQKTIGEYKFRLIQSINPFYWLFLPKYIFQYFNKPLKTPLELLLNFIYWLFTVVVAYLVELFLDAHISDWIQLITDKLQ